MTTCRFIMRTSRCYIDDINDFSLTIVHYVFTLFVGWKTGFSNFSQSSAIVDIELTLVVCLAGWLYVFNASSLEQMLAVFFLYFSTSLGHEQLSCSLIGLDVVVWLTVL